MGQVKAWLTDHGHEAEVHALNSRRAKKDDYVALAQSKAG
jgi:hypothetical protein